MILPCKHENLPMVNNFVSGSLLMMKSACMVGHSMSLHSLRLKHEKLSVETHANPCVVEGTQPNIRESGSRLKQRRDMSSKSL